MKRHLIRNGIFAAIALTIIIGFSFYVNDQPYWYKKCNLVGIEVDDATGLRRKSPVKTLGLEIGYIESVSLKGSKVLINVCITAPVKLREDTKAYIRSLGFLGDRFLELKPVDRLVPHADPQQSKVDNKNSQILKVKDPVRAKASIPKLKKSKPAKASGTPVSKLERKFIVLAYKMIGWMIPSAHANTTLTAEKETELKDMLSKVSVLVDKLSLLVGDVREVTRQKEFKMIIKHLNTAVKNLSVLLDPNGKFTTNIQSAMSSLRSTLNQAEQVMDKVNRGKGTLGKLVNDPSIYDEAKAAIRSINLLLGKAGVLKTYVDLSAESINAYGGSRATLFVKVEPNPTRYYLLGVSNDPRGREEKIKTETTTNGITSIEEKTTTKFKAIKVTAMFGKYLGPFDLNVGLKHDVGTLGIGFWFDRGRRFGIHADIYKEDSDEPIELRAYARAQIYKIIYVKAGIDAVRSYNTHRPYMVGVGIAFNDEDLKYLLAFK